ncbi:hypothetical protein BC829DRAFT_391422 [Chytridium lagenaria]|nr:hypothetical protein BC829DRAFT_391422 [Chytridium lagenaria]
MGGWDVGRWSEEDGFWDDVGVDGTGVEALTRYLEAESRFLLWRLLLDGAVITGFSLGSTGFVCGVSNTVNGAGVTSTTVIFPSTIFSFRIFLMGVSVGAVPSANLAASAILSALDCFLRLGRVTFCLSDGSF